VAHLLNLDLDIVFVDTPSTYFELDVPDHLADLHDTVDDDGITRRGKLHRGNGELPHRGRPRRRALRRDAAAAVLHPGDLGSAVDTAWGTREFAALDLEGNLLTFHQRQR